MNKLISTLIVAGGILAATLLGGCAKTPGGPKTGGYSFTVNQFLAVTMEYQGPRALVGVDTYGPTPKAVRCEQSALAAVSQADGMMPHGHKLVATCLHVMFGGPLPHGAAVAVPSAVKAIEYVTIAVEYSRAGGFIGAQALHRAPDIATCMREAHDVIRTNYRDGHVHAGESLLLYCVPAPVIGEGSGVRRGGVV